MASKDNWLSGAALQAGRALMIGAVLTSAMAFSAPNVLWAQEAPLGIAYDVTFATPDGSPLEDAIQKLIEPASSLQSLRSDPPPTMFALTRRADDDSAHLLDVLHSMGYYGATVQPVVDSRQQPVQVTLRVRAGEPYTLADFKVVYHPQADDHSPQGPESVGLATGEPAQADKILAAVERLRALQPQQGYPQAKIGEQSFVVDHATKTLTATVTVELGPRTRFGETTFTGFERVLPSYTRQLIPWTQGATWDSRQVEDYRRTLLSSGLFETVTITPGTPTQDDEQVPITVAVQEADHRSLGFGVSYSTGLGPSVKASWEHRNVWGEAEDFKTEASWGEKVSSLSAVLSKPNLGRLGQTGTISTELADENLEAYEKTSATASVELSRPLAQNLRGSVGVSLEQASLTDTLGDHDSSLLGLPVTLRYDGADDPLDPGAGFKLSGSVTPYTGLYEGPVSFAVSRADGSVYWSLDEEKRAVLAARAGAGTILGGAKTSVPVDKRFYAGGGGSVRGYGYQLAGTVDGGGNPTGGKSLLEAGLELRLKVTDTIGVVPFIEGGRAFDSNRPDFGEPLLWGAGLGLRYYSPVGPLRLDIATPLDPRPGVDDVIQIYASLGQAF